MTLYGTLLGLSGLLLVVGCGKSGDTNVTSCPGFMPGNTGSAGCSACVATGCSDHLNVCYGPGWNSGTFDGPCSTLVACLCPCTTDDCRIGCLEHTGDACKTCLSTVYGCLIDKCHAECESGSGSDMASGDGGAS